MKRVASILANLLVPVFLFGQTTYTGFLDKYPIELVTNIYGDGDARAIYTYTDIDEPIVVNGKFENNKLDLFEKDSAGKLKATLVFESFNKDNRQVKGYWKDLKTGRQYSITMTKEFDIDCGDSIEWKDREIIQPVSLEGKYFKVVISKEEGDLSPKVTGLKIFEKKTDKVLQIIKLNCQLWGLDNVSLGDYNFDGIIDFSVFEQSYAGPNTSSIYFLYNKRTGKYFNSGFEGSSLEFDSINKRIYEHNQCCGGTSQMNAEYKVVNNKMILVKKVCLEYNEEKQDFVEVKCN